MIDLNKYVNFDGIVNDILAQTTVRDRTILEDRNDYSVFRDLVVDEFNTILTEKQLLKAMKHSCKNTVFHINVDEGIESMPHTACTECHGGKWR
jgi:hypothetical protein